MSLRKPSEAELRAASPEEVAALAADCLAQLEPGRQPLELFTQMARLGVSSIVEVVPFVAENRDLRPSKVLLVKRSSTDPWWPNQWHVPGGVLLETDELKNPADFSSPAQRVLDHDFGGAVRLDGLPRAFETRRRSGLRGSELVAGCWAGVNVPDTLPDPENQRLFELEEVIYSTKLNLVEGHAESVERAVLNYQNPHMV